MGFECLTRFSNKLSWNDTYLQLCIPRVTCHGHYTLTHTLAAAEVDAFIVIVFPYPRCIKKKLLF